MQSSESTLEKAIYLEILKQNRCQSVSKGSRTSEILQDHHSVVFWVQEEVPASQTAQHHTTPHHITSDHITSHHTRRTYITNVSCTHIYTHLTYMSLTKALNTRLRYPTSERLTSRTLTCYQRKRGGGQSETQDKTYTCSARLRVCRVMLSTSFKDNTGPPQQ